MKRINLSWTDGRDIYYPTKEPNLTHVKSTGQGKSRLDFFKLARRFGTKIVSPRRLHGMSVCSGPTLA